MRLLIDAGNTRVKWAYGQDGEWERGGALLAAWLPELRQRLMNGPSVREIWVSNVAGISVVESIETVATEFDSPVHFITAQPAQCGVTNFYLSPESLGCDRWAALIGAWQKLGSACLVVNSGTATTIDVLNGRGEFYGGLILPGLNLMHSALCHAAAQIEGPAGQFERFPRNTADGIASGAIQATCGAILRMHHQLGAHTPILVGGGAAELLQPHLDGLAQEDQDLVFRGLSVIAEQSQSC